MKKKTAFFSFSRKERYGNTLLIVSFLILWVIPRFLPDIFPPPPLPEPPFSQQFVGLEVPDSTPTPPRTDSLFSFDPNKTDESTFILLGLPEKTARMIVRYREKGGKFRKKEDLARIYSLKEEDYQRLAPYISLPSQSGAYKPKKEKNYSPKKSDQVRIDVNRATNEEWQSLRGIGPGYAGRIVKFRDKLGGFSSIEQIGDTWGLPDSVFQKIKPQLIYSPVFRTISVNTASEDEIAAHPYISKKQARVILLFRNNHGGFEGLDDLKPIRVLPDSTLQKLAPYLNFEERSDETTE